MSVRFFYVDESYDETTFCLSAIAIRHSEWRECFVKIKEHRQNLKQQFGLFTSREIHSRELVAGKGRISAIEVGKWQRSRIFFSMLQLVSSLPNVQVFNVCLKTRGTKDPQMTAWDRLLNRIERTMLEFEKRELPLRRGLIARLNTASKNDLEQLSMRLNTYKSRAVIFSDEGRELEITKALRKMAVHNPIPSKFGRWADGNNTQNITAQRIIEDPIFKPSKASFFIQLADCVAFALLKREVPPTPRIEKYGIHKMFDKTIKAVCYTKASPGDPCGIVRK